MNVDWSSLPGGVLAGAHLRLQRRHLDPGASEAEHRHVEEEYWVFREGRCELAIDGGAFTARAGDVVRLEADVAHGITAVSDRVELVEVTRR